MTWKEFFGRYIFRVGNIPTAMLVAACLAILMSLSCPAHGAYKDAMYNFSSYEVRVAEDFCPGATFIFVDSFEKREVLGMYFGYVAVFRDGQPPVILEDVALIAVASIESYQRPISDVLQHECFHFQQKKRYADYFAFQEAFQKSPRRFETEAYQRGVLLQCFVVASVGDKKTPITDYQLHVQ